MLYNNDINVSIIALTDIIVIIFIIIIINIAIVILNGEKRIIIVCQVRTIVTEKEANISCLF